MKKPTVRLFITVYKNTRFLEKVLDSVSKQIYKNFEVSVLEDGQSEKMTSFLKNYSSELNIKHYTQEDIGFRKNKILNTGIRDSNEDLLIFIDGDCILHPSYIKTFIKFYKPDVVMYAKRIDLDSKTSENILNSKTIVPSKFQMLANGSTRIEDSFRIPFRPVFYSKNASLLGCNMAIPRKVITAINGFDEDYEMPGYGEDSDLVWRISKAGFKFMNLKFLSVQYHLFHQRIDREEQTALSRNMYLKKMEQGYYFCKNGLIIS